ncbi:MAG TPA: P-II family nitrogen regulator [Thermoanaerobacterales bacterium]|nr:P-II family nitrogen regulator [Thermoanaerobacterales bacterium]
MNQTSKKYSLFCVIIDFGKGNKILEKSKELGASGGTFCLGKGTIRNFLLDFLGLNEVRKEILFMVIEEKHEDLFHDKLTSAFFFNKPNQGVAFSMPIKSFIKDNNSKCIDHSKKEGVHMGYDAIFTVVNKGQSDEVIEVARSVGSTGGTVIHGRGSGSHETGKLFNVEIQPEKDIILILSKSDKTESIVNSIRKELNIDAPGTGIIFVIDVNKTSGLFGS